LLVRKVGHCGLISVFAAVEARVYNDHQISNKVLGSYQ
jgi:hypothetical protein